MPTYSYRCTECDNAFDIQQSFTDDTLTVCPVCGGRLRKVFSPIGVSFSGSGFYRTDSRPTPPSEGSASSSSSDSSSSSSSDSGSGSAASTPKTEKSSPKPESKPASTGASGTSAP